MNFNEKIAGTAQGKFKALLHSYHACSDSLEWLKDRTVEETVRDCHRGDWLLWLAKKIDLPLNVITLAKARCAKTVIHLMKDERSVAAIDIAERFGLDQCTIDELRAAASAAADAAAYAFSAVAAAAYVAAAADVAAYAFSAAYTAAIEKNRMDTANICREILGSLIIERVNQLITK